MSTKDGDGFRAWQRLKQRFEPGQGIAEFSGMVARLAKSPGETIALLTEMDRKVKLVEDVTVEEVSEMHALAARQGIMVARLAKSPGETIALLTEMDRKMKLVEDVTVEEVSEMHALAARQGIMARPAKSPGETIALLTEMDRKMKLVEDVTVEEVSEMHARSVLVGILDPVTRQHTAMNHSKSHGALEKIVQEFANNPTTSQEAMQIGRVAAGATAPTTAWPP